MTIAAARMRCVPKTGRRVGDHPLDAFIPDPGGRSPLCDDEQFGVILEGLVADEAPRLFAVVQEYGDRVDCRIAAWGMAFADRVEVASVEGGLRMALSAPESALPGFNVGSHVRARLVWFKPGAIADGD
ncbi:hypothetical protein SAMN05421805_11428 [Saccharopolyspora antimicrobica]|uniref:Uncharacterized protein n=1 Tax=Saccharopolyspora antimicrobica TaxID=455193 RepID=A0A1I5GYR0_9PSEU|nr:hypothetical protein [Saccharopolyspora antimicrobica]RKT89278.1 hypothetical protein ATL45_7732 [Saccharopolyspora antimicrobica]SFO41174.1 hypothetical protein SAMN05421805_11428 [Saccharopolyspora antimicrobica]